MYLQHVCVCGIKMRWLIRRQAGKEVAKRGRQKEGGREQQQSIYRTLPLEFLAIPIQNSFSAHFISLKVCNGQWCMRQCGKCRPSSSVCTVWAALGCLHKFNFIQTHFNCWKGAAQTRATRQGGIARVHTGNRGRLRGRLETGAGAEGQKMCVVPRSCKSTSTATQFARMKALKGKQPLWQQHLGCVCLPLPLPSATWARSVWQSIAGKRNRRQGFLKADQAWRVPSTRRTSSNVRHAACGACGKWQAASSVGQLQLPPLPPLTDKVCNENFLVKTKLKCEKMFNRIENKAERERG